MGLEGPYLISIREAQDWLQLCPLSSSPNSNRDEMEITQDEGPISLFDVTKMMLMVPNGGCGATSLWYP